MGIAQDRLAGLSSSVAIKGPCRAATTENITLMGLQTVDGLALAVDDRVLVKDQTDARENGVYYADTGPWTRAKDFSRNDDVVTGTMVIVIEGGTAELSNWVVTSQLIEIGAQDLSFAIVAPIAANVSFEQFGAVGDGDETDEAVGTNNVAAFVRAARYAKLAAGTRIFGRPGAVYRIAYNTAYKNILFPSNTVIDLTGTTIVLDHSELPATMASGDGALGVGDPDTFLRPNASMVQIPGEGNIVQSGFNPDELIYNVHFINPRILFPNLGEEILTSNQRLNGIVMWFANDSSVKDGYVQGTPLSGIRVSGGSNNRVLNCTVEDVGFGYPPGRDRNGITLAGYVIADGVNEKYSTHGFQVDNIIANNCRDEGLSFGFLNGATMTNIYGRGNIDRLIEGDTSQKTELTSAGVGTEIAGEYIISNVICDGRYNGRYAAYDGMTSSLGVSIGCDNETRLTLSNIRMREFEAEESPLAIIIDSGGRVQARGLYFENITIPSNNHLISIQAENIDVSDVQSVGCSAAVSSSNSSVIQTINAKNIRLRGFDVDGEFRWGVRAKTSKTFRKLTVDDMHFDAITNAPILLESSQKATLIDIRGVRCESANIGNIDQPGFICYGDNAFATERLIVEDNYCRWANRSPYPIGNRAAFTIASGAVDYLRCKGNDFLDLAHLVFPFSNPRSVSSLSHYDAVDDWDNRMLGQRQLGNGSLPTVGTWSKGDAIDLPEPVAGGTARRVIATSGTFEDLPGSVTATIVSGNASITVSSAADLSLNDMLTIATVTNGPQRIHKITGTAIDVYPAPDASGSGKAVTRVDPVFKNIVLSA